VETLNAALYGALAAMSSVAALFFLRYWRTTGDRFFVFIATSFVALAVNWGSLAGRLSEEHAAYFYLPRLGAFVLRLIGIIDKNRRASQGAEQRPHELP